MPVERRGIFIQRVYGQRPVSELLARANDGLGDRATEWRLGGYTQPSGQGPLASGHGSSCPQGTLACTPSRFAEELSGKLPGPTAGGTKPRGRSPRNDRLGPKTGRQGLKLPHASNTPYCGIPCRFRFQAVANPILPTSEGVRETPHASVDPRPCARQRLHCVVVPRCDRTTAGWPRQKNLRGFRAGGPVHLWIRCAGGA